MDQVLKDKRFSHVAKDPRFRQMSKQERKVKIDNRFKGMFSDKKFKLKYSVDKRGRPIQLTTNENLRKFYELDDDDDDDDDDDSEDQASSDGVSDEKESEVKNTEKNILKNKTKKDKKKVENVEQVSKKKNNKNLKDKKLKPDSEDLSDEESENEEAQNKSKERKMKNNKNKVKGKTEKKLIRDHKEDSDESPDSGVEKSADDKKKKKKKGLLDAEPDYARGEGNIESSSDEEEDGDDYNIEDEEFDHQWGELDKNVEEATELSNRLAVCNLDWDRIKAQDIFVSLNSFKPSNGVINSVKIYPSEYGLQRMKEEAVKGPIELVEGSKKEEDVDDKDFDTEDREGSKYHREKLRQYQLNRLKYYYAVVECDSVNTANQIYEECDGLEYETSATKLDLRFIPDGMEFDQEPKSICTEMPPASSYKPSLFFTSALCQSKVDLTWDETDKDRINITMKKITKKDEIKEDDFKAYLASSSDEEGPAYYGALDLDQDGDDTDSEDEQAQIDKYRKLAQGIKEQEKKHETKDVEMEITWEPGLKEATEKIIKKKEETKNATPWEEYLAKKKEKKKAIREQKKKQKSHKQSSDDETDDKSEEEEAAFSDDELPAGVDLNDPFFADELKDKNNKTDKKKGKKKSKKGRKEDIEDDQDKEREEAELDLLMMDDTEDNKRHFNLKNLIEDGKKKKKKKKLKVTEKSEKVDDDFEMDVKDERFNAIYTSHLYNIDPSAPEYKKTKAMDNVIKEKLDRRQKEDKKQKKKEMKRPLEDDNDVEVKHKKRKEAVNTDSYKVKNESLDTLVKSVKLKTQKFKNKFKT